MKKLSLVVLFVIIAFASNGQNNVADKDAVQMLKEFYTAYNIAWSGPAKGYELIKKLHLLQDQYCTISAKKELNKLFKQCGLDHDVLINDEYTDVAHLETMKITKESNKINTYTVSYAYKTKDAQYKPVDKINIIHVTVVKMNGTYKIDNTTGNEINMR